MYTLKLVEKFPGLMGLWFSSKKIWWGDFYLQYDTSRGVRRNHSLYKKICLCNIRKSVLEKVDFNCVDRIFVFFGIIYTFSLQKKYKLLTLSHAKIIQSFVSYANSVLKDDCMIVLLEIDNWFKREIDPMPKQLIPIESFFQSVQFFRR